MQFCGCVESNTNPFIPGHQGNLENAAYICKKCAYAVSQIFYGKLREGAIETEREDDLDFFGSIRK